MNGSYKKLLAVFILLLILVGAFNFQHTFSLSNLSTPALVFFIAAIVVFIWKLRPLLGRDTGKSPDQNEHDAKLDINIIKKSSSFFKGKYNKISYRKLRIILVDFLFFILLLSLFGYYRLYTLNQKQKHYDDAVVTATTIQLTSQQIRDDELLASFAYDKIQQKRYVATLRGNIESFKAVRNALRENIYDKYIKDDGHSLKLQQLFKKISPLIDDIINYGVHLVDINTTSISPASQLNAQHLENLEKNFLPLIRSIVGQYRDITMEIDKEIFITNAASFICLSVALILITWLVLLPVLRSGNKTYSELQELLKASKKSEAMLRTIINSTPDLIFVKNKHHKYQIVNQAFANESNTSIDAYLDKTDLEMGLPAEVVYGNPSKGIKGFWEDDEEVMASGQTKVFKELHVKVRDWNKTVTTVKVPLKDETGKVWGILGFVHDITELKRTEEELRQIHRLLEAVAKATYELIRNNNLDEAMGSSVLLLGSNLLVDKVNIYKNFINDGLRHSKQLVSWNSLENSVAYNESEFQLVPTHIMNSTMETLEKNEVFCSSVDDLKDLQARQWFKNKSVRSLAAFPIFVMDQFWGFVSFNDLTNDRDWKQFELSILRAFASTLGALIERKEMEEQLIIAKNDAQLAYKIKSQFMANMSHEFRTPMNGIIGFNQLLLATNLNERQRDYSLNIGKSANNLLLIINDVLDFSEIQEANLTIESHNFSLINITEDVLDILSPKAAEKGLELSSDIDKTLPLQLKGDPQRIKQILFNLVGNAIKFTETGKILITIKRSHETFHNNGKDFVDLTIAVSDTGIGIGPNELDKIFESFTQADSSTTRKYGGNGLGLSISKSLAELMKGRLSASSDAGKGSVFTLELRLEVATENTATPEMETVLSVESGLEKSYPSNLVMVVEDDLMNVKLISEVLRRMGVQTLIANNGKEALELIITDMPALIFMDINMPVMDGITAAGLIRKMAEPYNMIPIVALSADTMAEDIDRCLKAGMNSFISKPFKIKDITTALKTFTEIVKS